MSASSAAMLMSKASAEVELYLHVTILRALFWALSSLISASGFVIAKDAEGKAALRSYCFQSQHLQVAVTFLLVKDLLSVFCKDFSAPLSLVYFLASLSSSSTCWFEVDLSTIL